VGDTKKSKKLEEKKERDPTLFKLKTVTQKVSMGKTFEKRRRPLKNQKKASGPGGRKEP